MLFGLPIYNTLRLTIWVEEGIQRIQLIIIYYSSDFSLEYQHINYCLRATYYLYLCLKFKQNYNLIVVYSFVFTKTWVLK